MNKQRSFITYYRYGFAIIDSHYSFISRKNSISLTRYTILNTCQYINDVYYWIWNKSSNTSDILNIHTYLDTRMVYIQVVSHIMCHFNIRTTIKCPLFYGEKPSLTNKRRTCSFKVERWCTGGAKKRKKNIGRKMTGSVI